MKQYAYYNTPAGHKRLKMWTITSDVEDEKDISSVIRKALKGISNNLETSQAIVVGLIRKS